jgi:hypothetical protein
MSRILHTRFSGLTEMESEQLPRQLIFCFLFDGCLWWRQAHSVSPTRMQSAVKLRQFVFLAEFARRCGELAELSVQILSLHAVPRSPFFCLVFVFVLVFGCTLMDSIRIFLAERLKLAI